MEKLTKENIEYLLDFIVPRKHINPEIENVIVFKKKQGFERQLEKIELYPDLLDDLKKILENQYFSSLTQAGECVGITGAQSMGEFSTQATLNTFHVAGLGTGSSVNSGVSRFQELINASKLSKNNICYLYFKPDKKPQSISELRSLIGNTLIGLKIRNICGEFISVNVKNTYEHWFESFLIINKVKISSNYTNAVKLSIIKQKIFSHRLELESISEAIKKQFPKFLVLYSPMTCNELSIYVFGDETVSKCLDVEICGIQEISNYYFLKENDFWYVETVGGLMEDVMKLNYLDTKKTISSSVWDIYNTLGIEAVKFYLVSEFKRVMDGVDVCHIKLLVERMTYNGTISPITRYTMRNEEGPLCKASFEESMETFLKAAKFQEIDNFKGVSAAVIGGKKAKIGTFMCDILMDLNKIIEENNLGDEDVYVD